MSKLVQSAALALTLSLAGTALSAAPQDGKYSVTVPSKNPFSVTINVSGGNISGIKSATLQNISGASVSGNSKKQSISFNFDSKNCGAGNTGIMTFELKKEVVFKKWKGKCGSRRFEINKSIAASLTQ